MNACVLYMKACVQYVLVYSGVFSLYDNHHTQGTDDEVEDPNPDRKLCAHCEEPVDPLLQDKCFECDTTITFIKVTPT